LIPDRYMNIRTQKIYDFARQRLWEFSSPWRNLPEISGAIGKTPAQRKIAYAQYRKTQDVSPITWYMTALGFLLWAAGVWPFQDEKIYIIAWLVLAIGSVVYGQILGLFFLPRNATDAQLRNREKLTSQLATVMGVIWGLAGLTLPQNTREFDSYFMVLLLLVNTVGFTMFSIYRAGMLWHPLPATIVGAIILFMRGDGLRAILALGFLITMAEIFRLAYASGEMMEAALISEEEKKELLEELHLRRIEADKANHAKTRFLTAASHDLRQPINSVALLLGAVGEANQAMMPTLVNRMEVSIQSMDRLISAIAEASALDSGSVTVNVEPTALMPILEKLQQQFEPLASAKNMELAVLVTQSIVFTDAFQLSRMISNLISNAIRYTPHDGKVIVRCRERSGMLWIQVWDNGIGILSTEKDRIFEEFYQVNPNRARTENNGLGLGLYIVMRIAQRLKHQISVRSRSGRCTLMSIGVPACKMDLSQTIAITTDVSARIAASNSLAHLLRGLLVLVIEDDARVLSDMEIFLKSFQCTVMLASSSQAALALVENTLRTPDLIISDYQLGDNKNGVDTIQTIRQNLGEPVPAILITAEYVANDRDREKFANISMLAKPVNLLELSQLLRTVLSEDNKALHRLT
jgi:signal transduction histidine kinase/CheY-like chemotaxis protein